MKEFKKYREDTQDTGVRLPILRIIEWCVCIVLD